MKFTRRDGIVCLLLVLVTLAVYWQLTGASFAIYDDATYVTKNGHVQAGLNWPDVCWAFKSGRAGNWHPLTWISHMLDCQFFGLDAGKHHLTSILIHAANSCLLFLLLRAMTGTFWRSAIVAALFAWHPLHVESVAWIAERKDVLSTFFELLALFGYIGYASGLRTKSQKSITYYFLALFFFMVALMSKAMVVTLPCLLLLLDFWPLKRVGAKNTNAGTVPWTRLVLEKLPFFALSGVVCVVTYLTQVAEGATDHVATMSPSLHVMNALVAYMRYLGKLFWPTRLAAFYPYNLQPDDVEVAAALALLAGISALAIYWRQRRPYFIAGWFWFLGMLVPAIGIVQVGLQSMADRYTYVPAVGIFIATIWSATELSMQGQMTKKLLVCASVAALAGCLIITWVQIGYWHDPKRLFRHALNVTENNAVMEYNLGYTLQDDGNFNDAITHYLESLRINPYQDSAENNLGICLAGLGKHSEATNHYIQALKLCSTDWAIHLDYGLSLAALGDTDRAIAEYSESIRLAPDEARSHYSVGAVLMTLNRFAEAKSELSEAARLDPHNFGAHLQLAVALSSLGETQAAINEYEIAIKISSNSLTALNNLAWILATDKDASLRNGAEAVRLAERACELTQHKTPVFIGTLAAAYAEAGRFKEAVETGEQAAQLAAASGNNALAQRNRELVELYRANQAFHDLSQ